MSGIRRVMDLIYGVPTGAKRVDSGCLHCDDCHYIVVDSHNYRCSEYKSTENPEEYQKLSLEDAGLIRCPQCLFDVERYRHEHT